jgi:hypothetical protein
VQAVGQNQTNKLGTWLSSKISMVTQEPDSGTISCEMQQLVWGGMVNLACWFFYYTWTTKSKLACSFASAHPLFSTSRVASARVGRSGVSPKGTCTQEFSERARATESYRQIITATTSIECLLLGRAFTSTGQHHMLHGFMAAYLEPVPRPT